MNAQYSTLGGLGEANIRGGDYMSYSLNSFKGGLYRGLYMGLLQGLLRGLLGV